MSALEQNSLNLNISVIIPAFNVEKQIKSVLVNIPDFVKSIIVVDDASTDGTTKVVEGINQPRIHLLEHECNKGVGGAVKTGYAHAYTLGADILVKMDGDGQMDPAYLQTLIAPIIRSEADYTKGNRFLHLRQLKAMPLIRRIGNLGLSFLSKLASGYWAVFDPTNGYTAIHRKAYELLDLDALADDFFFESSMLAQLGRIQAVVHDVPVPAIYGDETSNLSPLKSLFTFAPRLMINTIKRLIFQYYLYDFTAVSVYLLVSIPSIIFGFVWGLVKWRQSILSGVVASTGTVLIAVLPIIIGIQFLTSAISIDINTSPKTALQKVSNRPKPL